MAEIERIFLKWIVGYCLTSAVLLVIAHYILRFWRLTTEHRLKRAPLSPAGTNSNHDACLVKVDRPH